MIAFQLCCPEVFPYYNNVLCASAQFSWAWFPVCWLMAMATVTPVTVLAPPVLSRGHIVNVITVNVKRATFIVKDMVMAAAMVSFKGDEFF